jgi:HEAT repeat protein
MSETPFITDALESSDGKKPSSKPQQKTGPLHQVIPDMLERGLLVSHIGSRLSFMHPVIAGYLAGTALASSGDLERVKNQPNWSGKNLALRYFAYWNDMTDLVTPELERLDDPLLRDFLTICRWIRISPKSANWRPTALRQVAVLLQREVFPVSIRARLMIALVTSGDPGAPILLRQNLKNPLSSLRQISALGCGMLKDTKSIEDLTILIEDPDPQVSSAALLALVSIGNKLALDAVAGTLLTSSEDKRRAAAEALANHAEEGHPALEEGSGMEDIMVRRAVVYGLARVSKPSALEKIEKLQVEDQQWVVRSAATQVIEILKGPNPYAPRRLPSLTQLPWLIVFAGKQGIGVAPGEPAKELLLQALRSEDTNERLAAMEYCALKGDVSAVPTIYQYFYGGDTQLREAASNTLWHMAAMGVHLPPPTQYGLG